MPNIMFMREEDRGKFEVIMEYIDDFIDTVDPNESKEGLENVEYILNQYLESFDQKHGLPKALVLDEQMVLQKIMVGRREEQGVYFETGWLTEDDNLIDKLANDDV